MYELSLPRRTCPRAKAGDDIARIEVSLRYNASYAVTLIMLQVLHARLYANTQEYGERVVNEVMIPERVVKRFPLPLHPIRNAAEGTRKWGHFPGNIPARGTKAIDSHRLPAVY